MNRLHTLLAAIFCCLCLLAPSQTHALPRVKAAILYNMSNGRILYSRNADQQLAPASLAKIMTMFLAMDAIRAKKLSYNQKITVSAQAAKTGGSSMKLKRGEKTPVVRLLSGIAVSSGNDAATAIAEAVAGNVRNFTARMNRKARALGMKRTVFKNPTGLPAAGQKTTAMDLLRLCRAYLKTHPAATRFHKMLYLMHRGQAARNTNPLLGVVPGVDGLKTGWTVASGYNLIVTAQRGKTRLLAIVLGGASKRDREAMASSLVRAGFRYPGNAGQVRKLIEGR